MSSDLWSAEQEVDCSDTVRHFLHSISSDGEGAGGRPSEDSPTSLYSALMAAEVGNDEDEDELGEGPGGGYLLDVLADVADLLLPEDWGVGVGQLHARGGKILKVSDFCCIPPSPLPPLPSFRSTLSFLLGYQK